MLMMQHKAPHRPWSPGPRHLSDHVGEKIPEPPTLFDDYANRSSAAKNAEMRISDHMRTQGPDLKAWDTDLSHDPDSHRDRNWFYNKLSTKQLADWSKAYKPKNKRFYEEDLQGDELIRWKYQRYMQDYLACVASVDDSVGELLDYLEETGLAENTIVIYSSDQGFYLGEHGWFDKRFMYEESLRTPLLVRWPGVTKPNTTNDKIVSNLDFAETFLDFAGVNIPSDMQGASITPLLRGESPSDWRDSFYYHYYEGVESWHAVSVHYGVTNGRYKLIHYYKLKEWELFDLEKDPHELNSVYGKPEYESVQREMEAELSRLRSELEVTTNDPV